LRTDIGEKGLLTGRGKGEVSKRKLRERRKTSALIERNGWARICFAK